MRREGPIAFGLIAGMIVILASFFNVPALAELRVTQDNWSNIAGTFASALGVISLTQIHMKRIAQKRPDAYVSAVLLGGMYLYLGYALSITNAGDAKYQWVYRTTVQPMQATVFALLAFYIASAAYRAFRARNAEATVLLICAVITMLGNVTVGPMIAKVIPVWRTWILNVPNAAGMRGIQIGAALGGCSAALRVLLGIERGHLGGE